MAKLFYESVSEAQREGFAVYDPRDSEGNVVLRRLRNERFELAIVKGEARKSDTYFPPFSRSF